MSTPGLAQNHSFTRDKSKPFYRVGVVLGYPWAWIEDQGMGENALNFSFLHRENVRSGH